MPKTLLLSVLSSLLLLGCGAAPPPADLGPPPPTQAELDLDEIQGRWVFKRGNRVVEKVIDGNREHVTYRHRGKMISVHAADISVSRSAEGGRVLSWSNLQTIAGRQPKADAPQRGEYMYNCDGNQLVEFQGAIGSLASTKADALVWKRDAMRPRPGRVTPPPAQAPPMQQAVARRQKVRKRVRQRVESRHPRAAKARERVVQARERQPAQRRQQAPARRPVTSRAFSPRPEQKSREQIEREEAARDDEARAEAPVAAADEADEVDETPAESGIAPLAPRRARRGR